MVEEDVVEKLLWLESARVDDCRSGGVCADGCSVLRVAIVPKVLNMEDVGSRLGIFKLYVVVRECFGGVGANVLALASLLVELA